MKPLQLPFVFIVFFCFTKGFTQSKDIDKQIKRVKENFTQVNSVAQWDSIVSRPVFETTQGGEATYYYKKAQLKKISAHQYGELFKAVTEYYLDHDKLSFVYEKTYRYNRPIYWDSVMMKENNDNQVWDIKKSTVTQTRDYFYNNQLIKQITTTSGETKTRFSGLTEEEIKRLQAFNKLLLSKNNPQTGN